VEGVLREAYASVRQLIERHRAATAAVAEALIVRESLHTDEILALIQQAETPALGAIAAAALASVPAALPAASVTVEAGRNGHAPPPETPEAVVDGELADAPSGQPDQAPAESAGPSGDGSQLSPSEPDPGMGIPGV
jgi:hypothetical protein